MLRSPGQALRSKPFPPTLGTRAMRLEEATKNNDIWLLRTLKGRDKKMKTRVQPGLCH